MKGGGAASSGGRGPSRASSAALKIVLVISHLRSRHVPRRPIVACPRVLTPEVSDSCGLCMIERDKQKMEVLGCCGLSRARSGEPRASSSAMAWQEWKGVSFVRVRSFGFVRSGSFVQVRSFRGVQVQVGRKRERHFAVVEPRTSNIEDQRLCLCPLLAAVSIKKS